MTTPIRLSYLAGLIIPLWLVIGVLAAGALYPNYSQINQAMSELGAQGAPTHSISPIINNYPLGVLFLVFAGAVITTFRESKLAVTTGALIAVHGLANFGTGYFSCDIGCRLDNPSASQTIHNYSGLVMFVSLFLASVIWVYLGRKLLAQVWFSLFSLGCAVVALAALPLMIRAVQEGQLFGLYQRINYGASVIWIAGLAIVLLKRQVSSLENCNA